MSEERRNITIKINGREVQNNIASINREYRKQLRELQSVQRGTDEYKRKVAEIRRTKSILDEHRSQIRGMGRDYGQASAGAGRFKGLLGGGLRSAVTGILGPIAAVGTAVSAVFSSVNKIREFSSALDELQSITGVTTEEVNLYKEAAIDTSMRVGMSATEIVNAYKLVGSAKPELLENRDALTSVTEKAIILSQATKDELAPTVASLTDIMNANNATAAETDRYINALAAGSQQGAKEVGYLSEALRNVGPVAKSANVEIEEQIALVELLGEKGIAQASKAGTGLRNVILALQADTANYTDGQFDMNKALENLAPIMEDSVALQDKFGKENVVVAQILAQNKDRFDELAVAVTDTNTAYEQAEINQDNLDGALNRFGATVDSIILDFSEADGILAGVVDFFATYLQVWWQSAKQVGAAFGELWQSVKELVDQIFWFIDIGDQSVDMMMLIKAAVYGGLLPFKMLIAVLRTLVDTAKFVNNAALHYLTSMMNGMINIANEVRGVLTSLTGMEFEPFKTAPIPELNTDEYKQDLEAIWSDIFTIPEDAVTPPVIEDPNAPKEGDEKLINGQIYVYRGGKWELKNTDVGGGEAIFTETVQRVEARGLDNATADIEAEIQRTVEAIRTEINAEGVAEREANEAASRERKLEEEKQAAEEARDFQIAMTELALNTAAEMYRMNIDRNTQRQMEALEQQKEDGLLTEEEYQEQREAIERRAFNQRKAADIAQAIINGALAVTKAQAQTGTLSPFFIPTIVATTSAQIATIAAQQYAQGGEFLQGPSHAGGGMPVLDPRSGAKVAELEGGEFIIRKSSVTPSTLPLLRAINGGNIPSTNFGGYRRTMYADGGMYEAPTSNVGASNDQTAAVVDRIDMLINQVGSWQQNLNVNMSYRSLEDYGDKKEKARKVASIRA